MWILLFLFISMEYLVDLMHVGCFLGHAGKTVFVGRTGLGVEEHLAGGYSRYLYIV